MCNLYVLVSNAIFACMHAWWQKSQKGMDPDRGDHAQPTITSLELQNHALKMSTLLAARQSPLIIRSDQGALAVEECQFNKRERQTESLNELIYFYLSARLLNTFKPMVRIYFLSTKPMATKESRLISWLPWQRKHQFSSGVETSKEITITSKLS